MIIESSTMIYIIQKIRKIVEKRRTKAVVHVLLMLLLQKEIMFLLIWYLDHYVHLLWTQTILTQVTITKYLSKLETTN